MRSFICLVFAGILMAFNPIQLQAGTVGKITGVVKDNKGEPLPGANVVVKGSRRGAVTDVDGYYVVLSVDPGSHTLEASLIGYNTAVQGKVIIRADFTTTVDFSLGETSLEAEELVVVARRPAIEPDKTESRYIIGADDIQNVPLARNTAEVIELQPGVSLDGSLRIRGSRTAGVTSGTNEIFVEIDGIRLANDDGLNENNALAQVNSLARGALQEVQVVTGGMEAEYGNAQGGVISMISRESKENYAGLGEYRMTLPGLKHWGANVYDSPLLEGQADYGNSALNHTRSNYDEVTGHFIEANLSGPISEGLGFFASTSSTRRATVYPNAQNREPSNIRSSGNLTYRPSDNMKFKFGGTWSYSDGVADGGGNVLTGPGGSISGTPPGGTRGISQTGKNLFVSDGFSASGSSPRHDQVAYAVFTHTVSPKTFYDIRVSWQRTAIDTSNVPAATGDILRDANGFYLDRDIHAFTYARRKRLILKGDLSSQMTKGHFFKTGFEVIRHSLYQHDETFSDTRSRTVRLVGEGDPIVGMTPFNPTTYALYAQDKMEFEGLIVRAGVRLETLAPGKSYGRAMEQVLWNHYSTLTRWRSVPVVDGATQTAISPRLGISHPITERASIRFFTGQFHQFTQLQHLYNRTFSSSQPDQDLNGNGQIDQAEIMNSLVYPLAGEFGNVDMKPERTTNFEVGVDWNFAGPYVLGLTAFYKDQDGQLSSGGSDFFVDEPFKGFNSSYSHGFFNRLFTTSRGFELALSKKFSKNTALNLAYNVGWVKGHRGGNASWEWFIVPDASFIRSDKYFAGVTVQSDGQEVPRVPDAAERASLAQGADAIAQSYKAKADVNEPKSVAFWEQPVKLESGLYSFNIGNYSIPSLEGGLDRRNSASVQFIYSTPADYAIRVLAGVRATMVWQMQSGTAYNYSPPSGPQERRNGPPATNTDASFEKDFIFGEHKTATVFLEVRNVWGQRDDTTTGFNWVQYGLQLPPPGDGKYDQFGDINELTRYNGGLGRPRDIVFGARFNF